MSDIDITNTNAAEISVSELAGALKRTLEDRFGFVRVRGEISGYRGPHTSGHVYFSLKDAGARLDAVIWKGVYSRMRIKPEEGLEVIATGKITTFANKSSYQIVVETIEPAGVGALMALLEARRRKLDAEGLFDPARKQLPPYMPRVIGVVTSPTGAVIRDILHRLADRFPVHVVVWPVRVQGETAATEITRAIEGLNALEPEGAIARPDVIIVARGGGSLEDLWSFNEENVVRAAADSGIPLISAVGHETDWTLIDYAADVRAPTPTAAAELSVPVRSELLAQLVELDGRGRGAILRWAQRRRNDLRSVSRALPSGETLLAGARQRLDQAVSSIRARSREGFDFRALVLARLSRRIAAHSPRTRAAGLRERHRALAQRLGRAGGQLTRRSHDALALAQNAHLREARRDALRRADRLETIKRRWRAVMFVAERKAQDRAAMLANMGNRLDRAFIEALRSRRVRLLSIAQLLSAVGYRRVLDRGFALVRDARGEPVRRAAALAAGQHIRIEFADGEVAASVDGPSSPKRSRRRLRDDSQSSLF